MKYPLLIPKTCLESLVEFCCLYSNDDIVLWKATTENFDHILKWIPWKNDKDSKIRAITFQPVLSESIPTDKIQLLVIS